MEKLLLTLFMLTLLMISYNTEENIIEDPTNPSFCKKELNAETSLKTKTATIFNKMMENEQTKNALMNVVIEMIF